MPSHDTKLQDNCRQHDNYLQPIAMFGNALMMILFVSRRAALKELQGLYFGQFPRI